MWLCFGEGNWWWTRAQGCKSVLQVISRSGKTHFVVLKSWLTQRSQHAFVLEAARPILTESDAQEGDSLVLSHLVPGTLVRPPFPSFFPFLPLGFTS